MAIRILITAPAVVEVDTPSELSSVISLLRHARVAVKTTPTGIEVARPPVMEPRATAPQIKLRAVDQTAISQAALAHLAAHGPTGGGALAKAIGYDEVKVRKVMYRLAETGQVASTGRTWSQRWALVSDSRHDAAAGEVARG